MGVEGSAGWGCAQGGVRGSARWGWGERRMGVEGSAG